MGRYTRTKKRSPLPWLGAAAVVLLALLALLVLMVSLAQAPDAGEVPGTEPLTPDTAAHTEAPTLPATEPEISSGSAVTFPISLAEGRLELESLFQFDGLNPDCGNAEGENVASLLLRNCSGEHLSEAVITLTQEDGTQLRFRVTELPAGKRVMAFCVDNLSLEQEAVTVGADCEAVFAQAAEIPSLEVTTQGIAVTLTNTAEEDLSEIIVYCRSPFGEEYFGGMAFAYTIHSLPAGETATVEARDCVLGLAEVIRVTVKEAE